MGFFRKAGINTLAMISLLLFLAGTLLVVTQDIQIFVELQSSLLPGYDPGHDPLPRDVERIALRTPDYKDLESWRLEAKGADKNSVALVLHGNGGTLRNFLDYQQWLSSLGITSYGLDYRGYGRSTGWPSEKGLYTDVSTLWDYVVKREALPEARIVLVGISLGSAPAAYLAQKHNPGALVLIGAFTSIKDVVGEHPVYFPLRPFIWHEFPTISFVKESRSSCAVFVHGEQDRIIDFSHLNRLKEAWNETHRFQAITITSPQAGHMNVFDRVKPELSAAVLGCLGTNPQ